MKKILFILLLFPVIALASPPLEFAGELRNGGVPVEGQVDLTFYIYAEEADEVPIWTEAHDAVAVSNGAFRVFLFSNTDISAEDLGIETLHIGASR